MNIASYVVFGSNGSVDHEATLAKFAGDLASWEAQREADNAAIGVAVHSLFDRHLGKRLPMPFLTGEVLKALNAQPENYKSLTEKLTDYVRTSPEFDTAKGKGGGCGRVCDLPSK